MKLTVNKPTEIEAVAIQCILPVRYGIEDIPEDFPFRTDDTLDITIEISSGIIRHWPLAEPALCIMKVVDEGVYKLIDAADGVVATREGYVPSCIPGEYGDYVELDIDATGKITNWSRFCTPARVNASFFGERD